MTLLFLIPILFYNCNNNNIISFIVPTALGTMEKNYTKYNVKVAIYIDNIPPIKDCTLVETTHWIDNFLDQGWRDIFLEWKNTKGFVETENDHVLDSYFTYEDNGACQYIMDLLLHCRYVLPNETESYAKYNVNICAQLSRE